MRLIKLPTQLALLALLLVPALVSAQDQPAAPEKPTKGTVEFGVRGVTGKVYGRPDLPFTPDVLSSKFNEYSDRRTGFFIRRFDMRFDDALGSKTYLAFQSQSTFYKNQSYLVTYGEYGKFKLQFRYDEIPHIYTNTTRTIFTETSRGVFTVPLALKTSLQTMSSTGTAAQITAALPNFLATQAVCASPIPPQTQPPACTEAFITPSILRRAGTGTATYNFNADWLIAGMFSRENQVGHRPIAVIFNSSPSASATGLSSGLSNQQTPGTGAEVPEPIDYFNNTIKVWTEYGKKNWGFQAGYSGSIFENNTGSLLFDNPFATADIGVQTFATGQSGCTAARCSTSAVPAHGRMDLYPNNRAHSLNFAGAFDAGRFVRVMGTVNPGWLRQNDPFVAYTENTQIMCGTVSCSSLAALPATSLHGDKQTLAMNWTLAFTPVKDVQLTAKYRHYDYNNNTPILTLTPILGDTIGANSTVTGQLTPGDPTVTSGSGSTQSSAPRTTSFNKKTLELAGNWFFTKTSSARAGYEGEWFDRTRRDVRHSTEHSFFADFDWNPLRDLLFRVAYRHSDRKPEEYEDEEATFNGVEIPCDDTTTVGFTSEQRCHRRFDEAARLLNRGDISLEYNLEKWSFAGSFQTIQQDFNRRGGTNGPVALNFLTGSAATTSPYYLYGALKDLSFIYSIDASYAFTPEVSLFAEYTHEKYHKRMISRYRTPITSPTTILTCNGCDTANNDWESIYRDIFDTYAAGIDLYLKKKVYWTTFYSLSAGKGNVFSRFLGDPTIVAPATTNRFLLVGSTAALNYPETTTRIHELAAVFKYKLTNNLMPKLEYRYQQFDNRDYQTTVMSPYMGCVSPAPTSPAVTGCPTQILSSTSSPTPILSPNGTTSFYPGFQVGDTASARFIFLGVDQPSYRVHILSGTLEVRF